MLNWFLNWQVRLAILIGSISVLLIFFFDFRGFQSLISFIISLILIYFGSKLYSNDTSENWIKFSYLDSVKQILGGVLMFFGWFLILRQVLALAIAAIFLKFA